jgi:hypothetical protein
VPDLRSLCGPEGIALLFVAVVFAIFWSRVMRVPSGVDYVSPSLPPIPLRSDTLYAQIFQPTPPAPSTPPPRRSMSCMVITVERRPPPPRIAEMQGGELWYRAPSGGWQMEHVES